MMIEKFPVENSSVSTGSFKSTAKIMPPSASNLKIYAYNRGRSILMRTIFKLMESHGEKISSQKFENFS